MFYFKAVRLTVKQSCLQIVPGYVRGATIGVPTSLTCNPLNSAVNILDPYILKKRRILNLCCKICSPFLLTGKKAMSHNSKSYSGKWCIKICIGFVLVSPHLWRNKIPPPMAFFPSKRHRPPSPKSEKKTLV
jgi:hypothetical protein